MVSQHINATKQALAAPVQQESVWLCRSTKRTETGMYQAWQVCSRTEAESHFDKKPNYEYKQFYTTPPAQPAPVPLTEEQIDKAATKLAECMDYPWAQMPEQGKLEMRNHAKAVIEASGITKGGAA